MFLPAKEELRDNVVAERIAGTVRTSVGEVLRMAELVNDGRPEHCLGLSGLGHYSPAHILEEVRNQLGWTHTVGEASAGPTYIDPDSLITRLDRARERLARAVRNREYVVFATGHPASLLWLYQSLAFAMRKAGALVYNPGDGLTFQLARKRRRILFMGHVAVLASNKDVYHTHSPYPMELVLEQDDKVDLVIADHGWAGAAAEREIDVISIANINDPALLMAKAEGRVSTLLGMDDNALPSAYDTVGAYLIRDLVSTQG